MRVNLKIQNLQSDECQRVIERNLSRILDMRIVNVDLRKRVISIIYDSPEVLDKIVRELWSIGFPTLQKDSQISGAKSNFGSSKLHQPIL